MANLMWLFIAPLIAAFFLFGLAILSPRNLKQAAFIMSLIPLGLLVYQHESWLGSQVTYDWFPALSIKFQLSVDSLTLLFLYLTALIVPLSILAVPASKLVSPHIFYGLVLLLEGLLIGFFTANDLIFFTLFWEGMLLPLYFIMAIWGGQQRQQAALKFLIYMIAGSVLMVIGVLALYFAAITLMGTGTFDLGILAEIASQTPYAPWICGIFLLAFAVKTPLFPFHTWLPDAYCQAPTSGTILLSGILSKAGIYGILRISMGFFPLIMKEWSPFLLGFAIAGVFYGALAAWSQKDFKRLIAYSSFSHVNFILVGLFTWSETAHSGALLQALNHGVTITALFLVAGWLEERLGTTEMRGIRGLAKYFPYLCWITLFFVFSAVAVPGTNNFVGELMIFLALFKEHPWLTAFLGLSIIFSAVYMLRFMQKVYFEEACVPQERGWTDIKGKEIIIALPLVILIIWMGMYPKPILEQIKPVADKIFTVVQQ